MIWAAAGLAAVLLAHVAAHSAGWWQFVGAGGLLTSAGALSRFATALARRHHHRWLQDVAFGVVCLGLGVAVILIAALGSEPKGDAAAMLIAGAAAVLFGVAVMAPAVIKARRALPQTTPGTPAGVQGADPAPEPLSPGERNELTVAAVLFTCALLVVAWDAIAR